MSKAQKLIDQLGLGNCTVEKVLNHFGGKTRNKVPKSVWGNTLSELVQLAEKGDGEAKTAVKILSQLDRLKDKPKPG
ncbi:MAG: hypothetical protein SNJ60_04295 [Pseudanabaenaceae cyanobacterium]